MPEITHTVRFTVQHPSIRIGEVWRDGVSGYYAAVTHYHSDGTNTNQDMEHGSSDDDNVRDWIMDVMEIREDTDDRILLAIRAIPSRDLEE